MRSAVRYPRLVQREPVPVLVASGKSANPGVAFSGADSYTGSKPHCVASGFTGVGGAPAYMTTPSRSSAPEDHHGRSR